MVYAKPNICLEECDKQTDHLISGRRPDLIIINKEKKENLENSQLCSKIKRKWKVKWKVSKWKEEKYLDLARELKKLWNMEVTIIPIVIGALGTVNKGLAQGLEDLETTGRGDSVQTTALLRSVRILRRVQSWRLEETCCHPNSSERPPANDIKTLGEKQNLF